MEKIKFVMTDTGAQVSAACRQALEAKGVAVTVCEKNGGKALQTLLDVHPQAGAAGRLYAGPGRHHGSNSAMRRRTPAVPARPFL